jgi:hypothetical protein
MATARKRRWSQRVTEGSDALTLDKGVFTRRSPRSIASSLKRSAERSHKRKSSPYRSAMSMLTFYLNRAGKTLPASSRRKVEAAKDELRALYGKPARSATTQSRSARGRRRTTKRGKTAARSRTRARSRLK